MIPGIESVAKYENVDHLTELIKKFKLEISSKIHHDLNESDSLKIVQ